ncbi:MAG: DUF188 domain-containing protein [Lachnospiraceae bacterium]|nr:DUF188 domain-containing protein [Lachnospiraceae bacterium]
MKILIDGDSCPVIKKAEFIARTHNIKTHIYCDTSHDISSDYSEVHIVDKGSDATDFRILSDCDAGDIVITNDGALASMVLSKRGKAINTFGRPYADTMIMTILTARHIGRKMRLNGNYKPFVSKKPEKHNFSAELLALIKQPI